MSLKELKEKIPVIRAKGSNYEIGFAHGSGAKKQINIMLENLKRSVSSGGKRPLSCLSGRNSGYRRWLRPYL